MKSAGIWVSETQFYSFSENALARDMSGVQAPYRLSANSLGQILKLWPNPDQILKKANKKHSDLKEVRDDAHVMAAVQSRKSGVLSMEWTIDKGIAANEINTFVRKNFEKLEVYDCMSQILEYFSFGFSVCEALFRYDHALGRVVIKDIVPRLVDNFHFDSNGLLRFKSKEDPEGELLTQHKFLVARNIPTDANPYGESLLSRCFWYVNFKKQMMRFWLLFAERFGMGFIIGQYKIGWNQDKVDALHAALSGLAQDSVAVVPEGSDVKVLDVNKTSAADLFLKFIDLANAETTKAILSHTGSTDSTPGKLGNENSAQTVREDIVEQDKRVVEKTINKLIKTIVDINFTGVQQYPTFSLYQKATLEKERADRDAVILQGGNVRLTKIYYTRNYGLKEDEVEEVTTPAASTQGGFHEHSESVVKTTPDQKFIDDMVEFSAKEIANMLPELLAPVVSLIDSGSSLEEVLSKIHTIFPKLNDEGIQKVIEHSLILAEATGRLTDAGAA